MKIRNAKVCRALTEKFAAEGGGVRSEQKQHRGIIIQLAQQLENIERTVKRKVQLEEQAKLKEQEANRLKGKIRDLKEK